jgi:hypothetical protein
VLGNHECNMDWADSMQSLTRVITNATVLLDSGTTVLRSASSEEGGCAATTGPPIKIFGTKFYWPFPDGEADYTRIPADTNVLVSHDPVADFVDGGSGCPALARVSMPSQPVSTCC